MEKERLTKLVKALQNGSEDAVTGLYNGCYNDIYYYILKTLDNRNDPELAADLTQDTFVEIIQTIGKLQDPEAFTTWSRKIAYHRCTAYFRKRHELLADEQEDGSTIFDTMVEEREEFIPGEALDKEDLKNTIRQMIDSLPEEQRSAIMMRYFEELSVQQIASIQSTTEGTVKSRLNYGRKAIKKAVEDYEKKHDVKLHCAGVIPLLLWLFRLEKRADAPGRPVSAPPTEPAAGKTVPRAGKRTASASAKAAARSGAAKVIAVVAAVAISLSALGIGLSLAGKADQSPKPGQSGQTEQKEPFDSGSSQGQITDVSPEDFCGTWLEGGNTLVIYFQTITERYYFEYYPENAEYFHFFAEFDPQTGAFQTPEGISCGFITGTDPEGNTYMDWRPTDNPAWRFTCQGNTLCWQTDENTTVTFHRDGTDGADAPDSVQYALADYPAYGAKVSEYGAAIFSGPDAYSDELYPTLNTLMLNYYHRFSEDAYFFYALEDIDSNGTPELLIGKGLSVEGDPAIIDLYSISGGSIVQYFSNPYFGERTSLSILAGGKLLDSGSSGASTGGASIYQISEDGGSVFLIANYAYYYPDGEIPPPDGDYMSPEEYKTAMAQYEAYPNKISWTVIEP